MFKTTLTKTLYSKRWMLFAWAVGLMALVVFTMAFFPTLRDSFGESLQDVPESLRSFLGDASTYTTIAGYTDLQVFAQLVFMLLIFGIILFTGVLAGEETDGTLQTLLAQPISRGRVYTEKLLAAMALLAGASLSVLLGVALGLLFIRERLPIDRLLAATLAMWLVCLLFSVLGFVLGAATGKRGLSGGIAGALAFTSFLVSTLAESVKGLQTVDKISPFHYFNKPGILQHGAQWSDMLLLASVSATLIVVGYVLFKRRDIYQR